MVDRWLLQALLSVHPAVPLAGLCPVHIIQYYDFLNLGRSNAAFLLELKDIQVRDPAASQNGHEHARPQLLASKTGN